MSAMFLASILLTVLGVLASEEPGCLLNLGHRGYGQVEDESVFDYLVPGTCSFRTYTEAILIVVAKTPCALWRKILSLAAI